MGANLYLFVLPDLYLFYGCLLDPRSSTSCFSGDEIGCCDLSSSSMPRTSYSIAADRRVRELLAYEKKYYFSFKHSDFSDFEFRTLVAARGHAGLFGIC